MSENNKTIGKFGEKIAALYLENLNYKIVYKNFKCRYGEVDIIATSGKDLVFIEVKTRHNINYGFPYESVNEIKLEKIKKISQYFLLKENYFEKNNFNIRVDIISIIISKELMNAILMEKDINPIIINNLKEGIDFSLEHIKII
ncbi:MAG: YraN family protein [Actinobacteria bacterium]|nr:YraN family protein [Cyanobacteriota bacterium]MCL5772372.1 YraN family protein [Actinomycetota bacterium]